MNNNSNNISTIENIYNELNISVQKIKIHIRKLFLEYSVKNNLKQLDKGFLTYDRVHLNDVGNQLVANAIWEAIK